MYPCMSALLVNLFDSDPFYLIDVCREYSIVISWQPKYIQFHSSKIETSQKINLTYFHHRKIDHLEVPEVMDKDCFFWISLNLVAMLDLNNYLPHLKFALHLKGIPLPPGRRNFERSSLVPHFGSIRYISFQFSKSIALMSPFEVWNQLLFHRACLKISFDWVR